MSPVPIYTPGWRGTKWSKVPCLTSKETTRRARLQPSVITAYLTPKIGPEIKLLFKVVNICSEIVDQHKSFVLISWCNKEKRLVGLSSGKNSLQGRLSIWESREKSRESRTRKETPIRGDWRARSLSSGKLNMRGDLLIYLFNAFLKKLSCLLTS